MAALLPLDVLLTASGIQVTIEKAQLLGKGSAGQVLVGTTPTTPGTPDQTTSYAVKASKIEIAVRKEVEVYCASFANRDRRRPTHLLHYRGFGQVASVPVVYFIVLELGGMNIRQQAREEPGSVLETRRVLQIGMAMVEGIAELHGHGFIHRDIKPANMVVGVGDKADQIFLLDFDIATYFKPAAGQHIAEGQEKHFIGTELYASKYALSNKVQSRKHDLEALFWSLVELAKGRLPWTISDSIPAILEQKTNFACGRSLPSSVVALKTAVDELEFDGLPDYAVRVEKTRVEMATL